MINLLPFREKEILSEEKKFKEVVILGVVVMCLLVSFSLILLSIRIFMSSSVEIQKKSLNQKERDFKDSQLQVFQEKVVSANQRFSKLKSFYQEQPDLDLIFDQIAFVLPSEISLKNISVNLQDPDSNGFFSLSGVAPNRNALLALKENLEKEGSFREIVFPPSTWIEPENINFSVTFKVK